MDISFGRRPVDIMDLGEQTVRFLTFDSAGRGLEPTNPVVRVRDAIE